MLTAYIQAALRRARYEILPDDGMFYGEIPGFEGVYAHTDTLEACRDELERCWKSGFCYGFPEIFRSPPLTESL